MYDYWLPFFTTEKMTFYNVVKFNDYHYSMPKPHKYLAEIFFRIDVNEVIHYRTVYSLGSWLGAIAGIERLLLKWVTFLFGGFL